MHLGGKQVGPMLQHDPLQGPIHSFYEHRAFLTLLLGMPKNRNQVTVIPVSAAIIENLLAIVILLFIDKYIHYKKVASFTSLRSSLSIKFYFSCYS